MKSKGKKMTKQYSNLVVLLALVILFKTTSGNAKSTIDYKKVDNLAVRIKVEAKYEFGLLIDLMMLEKPDFELTLASSLNDNEYILLRSIVGQFLTYGLDVKLVPIESMVLASQEYHGGGGVK
jgi:predicted RNase H-related nuclease YkuK (DUF458 family)